MTDLKKPQAAWTRLVGHELAASYLAVLGELRELERRYGEERTQVLVLSQDVVTGPKGVRLQGVALGRNTAPDGSLWLSIDAQRGVRLATAPGLQGLVAKGPLGQLQPTGGSGLGGSWDPPVGNAILQDVRVVVVPDWLARVDGIWDGSEPDDREARRVFLDALGVVAARLSEARFAVQDALRDWAQLRGSEFLGVAVADLAREQVTRDPSGSVSRAARGFLSDLASAMEAESNAGPQSVSPRTIVAAPAAFPASNRGRARLRPFQPGQACPVARWSFHCTQGAEQGQGGQEEFACVARLRGSDETLRFEGLRIGFPFVGPRGFGPLLLERDPSKKGDPQDGLLAPVAGLTIGGERSTNTDGGVLHWRLLKEPGGTWAVEFFMSLAMGSGDLVAKAEGIQPQGPFRASERNVSGLWLVWALGAQPRHKATGHVDLHFFRADGSPDGLTVDTTLQAEGRIQSLLSSEVGAALPSSPTPTIPDDLARAGVLSSFLIGDRA